MLRIKGSFLFVWILFLGLSTSLSANEPSSALQQLASTDSALQVLEKAVRQIDEHFSARYRSGAFNGNVLIAVKGVPVYNKSFGYANKGTGERLTPKSTFQLASTSKPFTAAAVLLLVEDGKVGLDDNLQKFWPSFPYQGVTVRHLLSHRSGLPDYLNFAKLYTKQAYIDNADLVQMMISRRPKILARPNAVFKYNNTNYALLAALVEKVSKQSFAEFCEERIFQPLGMDNTWVWHPTQAHRKGQTYGYSNAWVPRKPDLFDGVAGDKGIYSTTEDLLKWDQAWYGHTFLKEATIKQAYEGQTRSSSGKDYGLGWRMNELSGDRKMIYHNGWWHDYNIVFKRFIDDSTTIIIFSNKYNQQVYKTEIVESILFRNFSIDDYSEEPNYAEAEIDNTRNSVSINALTTHNPAYTLPVNPQPFTSDKVVTASAPGAGASVSADKKPATTYYTVKKGDTLFNISQRFNVSLDMLKQLNRLAGANIQLGQRLLIQQ
jgi:CubicO group peptidase (beta-lactamase class C family)